MVTCKVDSKSKMNRPRKSSSTSSGFRLLDGDQLDTVSSISRNSYYKLKIDSMFDDSRSVISQRLDDRRGSRRTGSIIMYGKSDLHCNRSVLSCVDNNDHNQQQQQQHQQQQQQQQQNQQQQQQHHHHHHNNNHNHSNIDNDTTFEKDFRPTSNSVQAQIERMFTDVVKDSNACSFSVICLGSLILQQKVTSLQGLQDPLRQLYLSGAGQGSQNLGQLDICPNTGLRVKIASNAEPQITPFHNIAVWSAVKFVVSPADGGAAFLPLITDPENIDKTLLFRPLTVADQRRLSSGLHAPIVAVVMRSTGFPKLLECHGFVCQTPEDAIVIAATLYQSLMAHVSTNSNRNTKRCTPRNHNGVSCISIASSAVTMHNKCPRSPNISIGRKNSSNNLSITPTRPARKKRSTSNTTSGESDSVCEITETTTTEEENKKKSHKTRRAPPIPLPKQNKQSSNDIIESSMSYLDKQSRAKNSSCISLDYHTKDGSCGDILTRVAIPRSGSFLNTSGLTRYKSRVSRRNGGKIGGGGGSPLGFSELFNEFRLHENLHSLDEILNAIIDADGMSFNDLKPIYKEFLLKLAVTLTKDELYQRSKNIMKRQKKKKLKRRRSCVPKNKGVILSAKGLKNVFWLGQFRSCKFRKFTKSTTKTKQNNQIKSKQIKHQQQQQNHDGGGRNATSSSDVSELRNENILNGINRNSSSGYVSCSECSYDSEACTCTSADRCYCSLGANHEQVNEKLTKNGNRDSLITCRTEDKCYCSMDDTPADDDDTSETTWCDSDSCISNSKCYCKRKIHNRQTNINNNNINDKWNTNITNISNNNNNHNIIRKKSEKLGLDYELFTVGCSGKSVRPHEALSAKKSAEAAATFADLKIIQTTDIKSFENDINAITTTSRTTTATATATTTTSSSNENINIKNIQKGSINSKHSNSTKKSSRNNRSSSADNLLSKLEFVAECNKKRKNSLNCNSCYQSMRIASSTSLEDSLGYLP